jgi:hypothetical protein
VPSRVVPPQPHDSRNRARSSADSVQFAVTHAATVSLNITAPTPISIIGRPEFHKHDPECSEHREPGARQSGMTCRTMAIYGIRMRRVQSEGCSRRLHQRLFRWYRAYRDCTLKLWASRMKFTWLIRNQERLMSGSVEDASRFSPGTHRYLSHHSPRRCGLQDHVRLWRAICGEGSTLT